MGCFVSTPRKGEIIKKNCYSNLGEVALFTPELRIPVATDFSLPMSHGLQNRYLERLSFLRTRIAATVSGEASALQMGRQTAPETQIDGSALSEIYQSIEKYLSVLLVLVKDGEGNWLHEQYSTGRHPSDNIRFPWSNQNNDSGEKSMPGALFEVLSMLHLMAVLSLLELNLMFLPKKGPDGCQAMVSHENKRDSIDVFLKAAGYLDCAVRDILPLFPFHLRKDLPLDLSEGMLKAVCQQALAQAVNIQLGIAIDSPKATLAVKRRLACEMLKHWQQADLDISEVPFKRGWGYKYQLYVKWKHVEAKAAAYYFHGQILDEGLRRRSFGDSAAAQRAAEEFLNESIRACEIFNSTPPLSSCPPLWGTMKYLSEMMPRETQRNIRSSRELHSNGALQYLATPLPDFTVALKPDDYELPTPDPSWNEEDQLRNGDVTLSRSPGDEISLLTEGDGLCHPTKDNS